MYKHRFGKNMRSIKKLLTVFLLAAIVISALTACKPDGNAASEKFLNEFFAINKDGRYTELVQKISEITEADYLSGDEAFEGVMSGSEEHFMEYYEPISKYMTEDGISKLVKMRGMVAIDAACMEKGDSWKIENITVENVPEGSLGYKFETTVVAEGSDETLSFKGDITLEEKNGNLLVATVLIDE